MNKQIRQELGLREQLRLKLLEANALVTSIDIEEPITILSTEEILKIGQLPPNVPTSTDLIDEDRGIY
jgi:hypothetical protein